MGNNFFVLKQIGNKAHLNIEVVKYAQNLFVKDFTVVLLNYPSVNDYELNT